MYDSRGVVRHQGSTNADVRDSQDIRDSVRVACRNAGVPVQAVATDRLPHGWKVMVYAAPEQLEAVETVLISELWDYIVISTSTTVAGGQGQLVLAVTD